MKAVTLKNIPDDILTQIKSLASVHHRSLNHEIIWCLTLYVKTHQQREIDTTLAEARKLRTEFTGTLSFEEIQRFKSIGRL